MIEIPESINVLGVPLACVDYGSATDLVQGLAKRGKPAAVAASNTHIVSAARHYSYFGDIMKAFDLILPDGMPLIWAMNLKGAGLKDRVYGPYFMRHMLQNTPRPWKHFFFGGTEHTLSELIKWAVGLQPDLEIAGVYSPPFCEWTENDEKKFAALIKKSGADFVWVALGGERQERWIIQNQHRYEKGVFFAVGDAFALLAGLRTFAPSWMQRLGLTWLYRLIQEPTRLSRRYFKYNCLFIFYAFWDFLKPRKKRRRTVKGNS